MTTTYAKVNNPTCGACLRIPGDGILAHNAMFAMEPGRVYRLRFAGIRVSNSIDPELDAIDRGVAFYDASKSPLAAAASKALLSPIAPTVTSGRWSDEATVSRGGGGDIVAPVAARYFRPYVQTYGNTPITDIETIEAEDVTSIVLSDSTHYQEGSWSPTVSCDGTAPIGVVYDTRNGWYTRTGNLVVAGFQFDLSSKGSGGVGALVITALPFAVAGFSFAGPMQWENFVLTGFTSVAVMPIDGTHSAWLSASGTGASSNLAYAALQANSRANGHVIYHTGD